MDTPNDNTIIKYFGNYRIPLHSETWDSYSKEWKDGVDREDLTKFLRLFGV
ncbi:hypothetical protein J6T66_01905 [bacterium]|nr:hypothetical protein [bacterium]